MPFCAICIDDIEGQPHRAPVGDDGALYDLCRSCATEPAKVRDARAARRGIVTRSDRYSPGYVAVKAHRAKLRREGLCRNGRKHGPATSGELCADCRKREDERKRNKAVAS